MGSRTCTAFRLVTTATMETSNVHCAQLSRLQVFCNAADVAKDSDTAVPVAATRSGDDGDGGGGGARSSSGALSSLWLDYARDGPDRDWAVAFRTPPVQWVVATALGLGGVAETGSPGSWSLRRVSQNHQATGACSCVERVWQCTRRARPIRVLRRGVSQPTVFNAHTSPPAFTMYKETQPMSLQ